MNLHSRHGILPDDSNEENLSSTLDRTCLQQLKLSYCGSNTASNIILKDVWESNSELFNLTAKNQIKKSAETLLHNVDTSQSKKWKSSLSKMDVESLFLQSLPACTKCPDTQYKGYENFFKAACKCELDIDLDNSGSTSGVKSQSLDQSSQESKSSQDKVFRPKFAHQRQANKNIEPRNTTELTYTNIETENLEQASYKKLKFKQTSHREINTHSFKETSECTAYSEPRITEQKNKERKDTEVITLDFDKEEEENRAHKSNVAKITFKTAKETLLASNPAAKRTLGASRKAQGKFVSPMIGAQEKQEVTEPVITDERLKNIDPKMIELIESEIIDKGTPISWDDIAGLQLAKSVIQEAVVLPLLRPDIFTGLRRPPKGILLFGPPGTGKTLIGKCVASQCRATFFSISASSLTSKWIGDGEKMVRALFAVARCHQPAVIFIDEIDSLLTQRSDTEHEATRRIKTEFLVQFDGAAIGEEDRLLIVGATNRPQELDEAARRRLVKRLYIPLPDINARRQIITNLLKTETNELSSEEVSEIASKTAGYSGADMKSLCSEAAMGPVRALPLSQIATIHADNVRPVCLQDFIDALRRVRPSVSQDDLGQYIKWNQTYGQGF